VPAGHPTVTTEHQVFLIEEPPKRVESQTKVIPD
jgi:hypothetical protein